MNTKRDRRLTPTNSSLVAVSGQLKLSWDEAIHREGMELKADTASDFYLDGEGTSGDKEKSELKDIFPMLLKMLVSRLKDNHVQIYFERTNS